MEATIEIKEQEYDDFEIKTVSGFFGSKQTRIPRGKKKEFFVELILIPTEEEKAIIYKYEIDKLKFDEHPKYTARSLAAFIADWENHKIVYRSSPEMIAMANLEIQRAPDAIQEVTLEQMLQPSYTRTFDVRQDAHEYSDKLEKKILPLLKHNIDYYKTQDKVGNKRTLSF